MLLPTTEQIFQSVLGMKERRRGSLVFTFFSKGLVDLMLVLEAENTISHQTEQISMRLKGRCWDLCNLQNLLSNFLKNVLVYSI